MARDTKEVVIKKSPIGKIATILGSIAALVAAATPGTLEYLDKTDERAHAKAVESQEQSDKSEGMTELAWEKTRLELLYLRKKIEDLEIRDREKSSLFIQILKERINEPPPAHPRVRPVRSSGRGSGSLGAGLDLLDDPLGGLDLGEPQEAAKELQKDIDKGPPAQIQQQLPMDLEKEWKKSKKKGGK